MLNRLRKYRTQLAEYLGRKLLPPGFWKGNFRPSRWLINTVICPFMVGISANLTFYLLLLILKEAFR
jgi:hypothetical protein